MTAPLAITVLLESLKLPLVQSAPTATISTEQSWPSASLAALGAIALLLALSCRLESAQLASSAQRGRRTPHRRLPQPLTGLAPQVTIAQRRLHGPCRVSLAPSLPRPSQCQARLAYLAQQEAIALSQEQLHLLELVTQASSVSRAHVREDQPQAFVPQARGAQVAVRWHYHAPLELTSPRPTKVHASCVQQGSGAEREPQHTRLRLAQLGTRAPWQQSQPLTTRAVSGTSPPSLEPKLASSATRAVTAAQAA